MYAPETYLTQGISADLLGDPFVKKGSTAFPDIRLDNTNINYLSGVQMQNNEHTEKCNIQTATKYINSYIPS